MSAKRSRVILFYKDGTTGISPSNPSTLLSRKEAQREASTLLDIDSNLIQASVVTEDLTCFPPVKRK